MSARRKVCDRAPERTRIITPLFTAGELCAILSITRYPDIGASDPAYLGRCRGCFLKGPASPLSRRCPFKADPLRPALLARRSEAESRTTMRSSEGHERIQNRDQQFEFAREISPRTLRYLAKWTFTSRQSTRESQGLHTRGGSATVSRQMLAQDTFRDGQPLPDFVRHPTS